MTLKKEPSTNPVIKNRKASITFNRFAPLFCFINHEIGCRRMKLWHHRRGLNFFNIIINDGSNFVKKNVAEDNANKRNF